MAVSVAIISGEHFFVRDLLGGLNAGRDIFVILKGFIDDSGNQRNTFTLSCLLAEGTTWTWIETDWINLLEAKNRELVKVGRRAISRYHAADCSSCVGEFEGWTIDEQKDFTKHLLDIFRNQSMINTISFSLNLTELKEEMPWTVDDPLSWAHRITLEFMMLELGNQIGGAEPTIPVRVVLIHDRSDYDAALLQAFNHMISDVTFTHRGYFSTIAPMGWEDCIPLQAADLFAYENYKEDERRTTKRNRRYTLRQLLEMQCFSGRSRGFDRNGLRKLADAYKENNPQWR